MSDDRHAERLAEIERRVAAHEAAGDYDASWLDAEVVPITPLTPVDRYLQSDAAPRSGGLRGLANAVRDAAGERQALLDERLRAAVAWLALAHTAEQGAREALAAAARRGARGNGTAPSTRCGSGRAISRGTSRSWGSPSASGSTASRTIDAGSPRRRCVAATAS